MHRNSGPRKLLICATTIVERGTPRIEKAYGRVMDAADSAR
jgi:hypothetical protein